MTPVTFMLITLAVTEAIATIFCLFAGGRFLWYSAANPETSKIGDACRAIAQRWRERMEAARLQKINKAMRRNLNRGNA